MDTTTRKIAVALGILLIVALALSSTMGGMMGPGMMGRGSTGHWDGWMWGAGMWLGGLAMLILGSVDRRRDPGRASTWRSTFP